MRAWYWCPRCQRAFCGNVPGVPRSPLSDLLTVLGALEPPSVNCPFPDCGATARVVMTWAHVRKWAEKERRKALPAVPAAGQRYELPPSRQLQPVER